MNQRTMQFLIEKHRDVEQEINLNKMALLNAVEKTRERAVAGGDLDNAASWLASAQKFAARLRHLEDMQTLLRGILLAERTDWPTLEKAVAVMTEERKEDKP